MTIILSIHLILVLLGTGVFLLLLKTLFSEYVRKITNLTFNPSIVFNYLLKSPLVERLGLLV